MWTMNKVAVVPVSESYGAVKWLFNGRLMIELCAHWNDWFPGLHAKLTRNGTSVAVMNANHEIVQELSDTFYGLTPNAQKHVLKMLKQAIDSDASVDRDEVTFTVEVV